VARVRSVLAAVALIVLAGCGAPTVGSPPEPTSRLTPVPVPTAPDDGGLAPGVTEAGVVDATALKDAHVALLRDGEFTVRRVRVERFANGSLRARTTLAATYPGDGRYRVERTFEGPDHDRLGTAGTTIQYGNATGSVRLRRAPNGTVLDRSLGPPSSGAVTRTALLTAPFSGRRVLLMLRAADVADVTPVDGRAAYRLSGSGIDDPAALRSLLSPSLVDGVDDVTATAVVTDSGLVERLEFAYTAVLDGQRVRIVRTVRYETGNATLNRPAWVGSKTETAGP
jgi:hypothetical protein